MDSSQTPDHASPGGTVSAYRPPDERPSPHRGEPIATIVDARPAALINGQSVLWGELRPILNEAAGAQALQEILLDRRLNELTAEAGIQIAPDDVAAEQRRLLETLNDDPNTATRLLDALRDREHLGNVRFQALLRRNAMLRALVRDQVHVTDEEIERMYDTLHGPKRQVRLLTVGNLAAARAAIVRIGAGAFFGDIAVEISTDASASRGGLLEPISRSDRSYPLVLRQAVWALGEVGDLSNPILLPDCYAVVQLVREIEAADRSDDAPFEQERQHLQRLARMNQERLLMDRLARRILSDASVMIFDDSLRESWQRFERSLNQ